MENVLVTTATSLEIPHQILIALGFAPSEEELNAGVVWIPSIQVKLTAYALDGIPSLAIVVILLQPPLEVVAFTCFVGSFFKNLHMNAITNPFVPSVEVQTA